MFVISSKVGLLEPDARIYRTALEQIGCAPQEVLFVDDDADYVRAAESLGMQGAVISREGSRYEETANIASLTEVKALIWR